MGDDCIEMNWIDSVMHSAGFANGKPVKILLDRGATCMFFGLFKAKSVYVTEPISGFVWGKIWPGFLEQGAEVLIMDPCGGKNSRISESQTPFLHRDGNQYNLQYFVK